MQKSIENFVFRPKMAIFRRAGMREGGLCDLNLGMISSLASKWQDFKLRGLQFHFNKQLKKQSF